MCYTSYQYKLLNSSKSDYLSFRFLVFSHQSAYKEAKVSTKIKMTFSWTQKIKNLLMEQLNVEQITRGKVSTVTSTVQVIINSYTRCLIREYYT